MFLIVLLALTIAIFGTDATGGPLQVALLTSAAFAALVALRLGHAIAEIRDAAVGGDLVRDVAPCSSCSRSAH